MPWRSYIRSKRPFLETIPKLNLKFESFRVFRCIWNLFAGILLVRFPKIQLFSSQIPATSESSKFLDWVSSLVNCILFIYCILVNKKALFTLKYLENNRFFKFFYFAISQFQILLTSNSYFIFKSWLFCFHVAGTSLLNNPGFEVLRLVINELKWIFPCMIKSHVSVSW